MKKAFSLVELIVVMGIIGVLAGVLLVSFGGSSDSAKCAQCLANMRNLAAACQTVGGVTQRYPLAGSIEWSWVDESGGFQNIKERFNEYPGWISWYSKGVYTGSSKPTSHQASSAWMTSMYSTDREKNIYCLTNGILWKYVAGHTQTYVCPLHAKAKHLREAPVWSYLMNSYFGWDNSKGGKAVGDIRKHYGDLLNAEKRLLFAEVPFNGIGPWQPDAGASGTDGDCVLQYKTSVSGTKGQKGQSGGDSGYNETIGCNHKVGKFLFANVAFADGHAEKLTIPYTGSIKKPQVDSGNLTELTAWLCMGLDVSFDGKQYKKVEK